jgi:hypothetical protein
LEVVQDYMRRLQKVLTTTELAQFAVLLRTYREKGGFESFSAQLLELYGEDRKFLLPGMSSFIPKEDKPAFEVFLDQHHARRGLGRFADGGDLDAREKETGASPRAPAQRPSTQGSRVSGLPASGALALAPLPGGSGLRACSRGSWCALP